MIVPAARGLPRFIRDRRAYARLAHLEFRDDYPQLLDWTETTPYDAHYTHQDAWAAREIHKRAPARHVDVGSRISFVAGIAAFVATTFVDLRPLEAEIPNLTSVAGTVLDLPFVDGELESVSCLHVAEHIGLGRYGDPLDPDGTRRAAAELMRVLGRGGTLYFSLPIGRPRTQFNAHRVHDPLEVPRLFPSLELAGFEGVDDAGRYRAEITPADLSGSEWACGFYRFTRPR
jgi:SAM-dependent methyltransferase